MAAWLQWQQWQYRAVGYASRLSVMWTEELVTHQCCQLCGRNSAGVKPPSRASILPSASSSNCNVVTRYAPAAAGPRQASVNAATIPRVATASGDRALEKSYKPKKLLSLHRKKRWPSTRPPAVTRATPRPPRRDQRQTAATAASTPTPARSRRPASPIKRSRRRNCCGPRRSATPVPP